MPGIIGPSRAGVTTPADIARSMQPSAVVSRGGGSFYNPATMQPVNPLGGMTLREKQQFLADHGFDIDVDGVWGPQTAGAWKNLAAILKKRGTNKATKRDGDYWSKNSKLSNSFREIVKAAPKATPSAPPVVNVATGKPAGSTNRSAAVPTGSGKGGGSLGVANFAQQLAQLQANLIDPKQYMAMMGQGQQSAIKLLQDELTRRSTRPSGVDDNLKKWYESMIAQNNAGAAAVATTGSRVMADQAAGAQGLANILGGSASPAASMAAAQGQIGANELAANVQALGNFYPAQGSEIALKGVADRLAAQQDEQGSLDELRMQLIQAQADAAMGKGKNWLDALQLRGNQINDIVDLKGLMAMAPMDAKIKQQTITQNALQNRALSQDYDIKALQAQLGLKQLQTAGQVTPWGQLDPGKLSDLRTMLLKEVTDKTNTLAKNPMEVYNAWGSVLRSVSQGRWNPFNNPTIDRWRDDLLTQMLPGWNRAHPKQKYAFRKGKLVRIP